MIQERLYKVLVGPYTTEKTVRAAESNKAKQIAFKVAVDATKDEIKRAVQEFFKVKVTAVNVINVKGKAKSFRQVKGKKRGFRKANVTLEEGQDINWSEFE